MVTLKSILVILGAIIVSIYTINMLSLYIKYKKKKLSSTRASNNYKILRDIIKTVFTKGKTIKEACDIIIGILRSYYPIDYITIFEFNNEQKHLNILSTNIDKPYIKDIEVHVNNIFEEVITKSDGTIMVGETPDTILQYPSARENERQINYMFIIPLTTGDSTVGALLIENKAYDSKDKVGQPYKDEDLFRVITNNISVVLENYIYNQKISTMATTDGLTGVYNRYYMEGMLDKQIEDYNQKGMPFSITILDIDKFKNFNDTHGHLFGDYVLKQTAAALKVFNSRGCVVTRYGGEEFLVLISSGELEVVVALVEEMREKISEMVLEKDDQTQVKITASFGISFYPADANNKDSLIENADKALYYAKETGRNKVVAYSTLNDSDFSKYVSKRSKNIRNKID